MLRAHKVKQMELRLVIGLGKIEPSTLVLSDVEGGRSSRIPSAAHGSALSPPRGPPTKLEARRMIEIAGDLIKNEFSNEELVRRVRQECHTPSLKIYSMPLTLGCMTLMKSVTNPNSTGLIASAACASLSELRTDRLQ